MTSSRIAPIITLTTDFGLSDHYVGTMKGVILSRCSNAQIVDISHEIPQFSTYAGAYAIAQSAPYFPPGTIHVVVVDPGVGTERRAVLVEAANMYFVAPDNGVLSLVLKSRPDCSIREISNERLWLAPTSHTFHGRDIFAPVAAALAASIVRATDVGPQIESILGLPDLLPSETEPGVWRGRILSIDHFGNVITNFSKTDFPEIAHRSFAVRFGGQQVTQFQTTFGEGRDGLCFAYFGSSGYLELGINMGSAAAKLHAHSGDVVELRVRIGK
jgi:S-adenosyl-L-methionine hydrolase (adenosine-forming)